MTAMLTEVEVRIRDERLARMRPTALVVEQLIERLRAAVAESDDYDAARLQIDAWIASTVRFLYSRGEMAPSTLDYLAAWDAGTSPPHEARLADDYVAWLLNNDLGARVRREVPAGGGRIDVFVEFDVDVFMAEVKRELSDPSNEALEDYALQEALYLKATLAIGMLLVLDLTPGETPIDIRDQAWVKRLPVQAGRNGSDRFVCIFRIKGNRQTPSEAGRNHVADARRRRSRARKHKQ
jgi:hypothetical protein